MGLNLGVLGSVLSQGAAGYGRGQMAGQVEARRRQQEDEDRKRQAEEEALRMQLMQGQIAHQNQPDPVNWDTRDTPDGAVQVNPQTGEVRPLETAPGHPVQKYEAPAKPVEPEWQKQGYPDFASWRRDQTMGKGGDRRAKWQQEGYPTFEAWRDDQRKATTPDPDKERRDYILKRVPELSKPRDEHNEFGESTTVPGLSPSEAYAKAADEYGQLNGQGSKPDLTQIMKGYVQKLNGQQDGGQPMGNHSAPSAPTATPSPQGGKSRADRWEELVDQGMTEQAATQKVLEEYGQ